MQSDAVVAKAVADAPDPAATHALVSLMEHLSDEPLYKDNSVGLLVDGPATYDAMLAAIRAARRYVHIEMYIVGDDEVGRTFAELLIEKAREGVAVRLIYDAIGSREASEGFFDRMREAGIEVIEFGSANPLDGGNPLKANNRDHRKILIVDGEAAFTGGLNIDKNYSSSSGGGSHTRKSERGWRDTDVVVQGPAVTAFEQLFRETWDALRRRDSRLLRRRHTACARHRTRSRAGRGRRRRQSVADSHRLRARHRSGRRTGVDHATVFHARQSVPRIAEGSRDARRRRAHHRARHVGLDGGTEQFALPLRGDCCSPAYASSNIATRCFTRRRRL